MDHLIRQRWQNLSTSLGKICCQRRQKTPRLHLQKYFIYLFTLGNGQVIQKGMIKDVDGLVSLDLLAQVSCLYLHLFSFEANRNVVIKY